MVSGGEGIGMVFFVICVVFFKFFGRRIGVFFREVRYGVNR